MSWDVLIGGAMASMLALLFVEVVWLPLVRRWRLRTTGGRYHVHTIEGMPIRDTAGNVNYVELKVTGWLSPKVSIEAFDYDQKRSWSAVAKFDELGVHGHGYYKYGDQTDGGAIELFGLAADKWACRTNAYHVEGIAVFHWYKQ